VGPWGECRADDVEWYWHAPNGLSDSSPGSVAFGPQPRLLCADGAGGRRTVGGPVRFQAGGVAGVMRVAICTTTALFREALAAVLRSRGHEVACCPSALADAIGAVERSGADVLLLDASLTDVGPLAQLRRDRGVRVLLLAESGKEGSAYAAVDAGAADTVLDHAVALVAVERALDGRWTSGLRPRRAPVQVQGAESLLTLREREVIGLLLTGRSSEGIAVALGVSGSTVHSHVQSILRKLGARSRIEAVSMYLGEATPRAG
jgi:DNA-binding NarL/FixJ family response regulator